MCARATLSRRTVGRSIAVLALVLAASQGKAAGLGEPVAGSKLEPMQLAQSTGRQNAPAQPGGTPASENFQRASAEIRARLIPLEVFINGARAR